MVLSEHFFSHDTVTIARELLGTFLVHESHEGLTVGKIVETEAYLGSIDPASHAYRGMTQRNRAMFEKPGKAYIYFTYGMYYCFNVTTAPQGVGEAVLIRALEPLEGEALMARRRLQGISRSQRIRTTGVKRNVDDQSLQRNQLCSGPAKLVIAMGITKDLYGHDLREKPLYIVSHDHFGAIEPFEIVETTRIGISQAKDLPLRFYIKGNQFISRK
jgi:DNA-3-methyladenine glycosylase